jgi:hypothetical protein
MNTKVCRHLRLMTQGDSPLLPPTTSRVSRRPRQMIWMAGFRRRPPMMRRRRFRVALALLLCAKLRGKFQSLLRLI